MDKLEHTLDLMNVTLQTLVKAFTVKGSNPIVFNGKDKVIMLSAPDPRYGYGSYYTLYVEMETCHYTFEELMQDFTNAVSGEYESIIEAQKEKLGKIAQIVKGE